MKQHFLLSALLCCALFFSVAKATETEPNNTRAQANTLALNGSNSGKINPAADVDWYKVTTNGDGRLNVTLTPLSGRYMYVYLYDNDGVTQLAGTYSTSAFTISADGLATGTYYAKVVCYYNTDTSSYTISNTLTQPAQANDAEPDSTRALALTLPLNDSVTGHVGYYYKNHRDSVDWYKVTTNADGLLRLTLKPVNGQYTYVTLYDNDGKTQLNTAYSSATFSYSTDGLAAGTYYVKVFTYYNTGFTPYVLSDSLFTPAQANDAEPNDTKAQAIVLPLNGSKTGHAGYYYNNKRDSSDWYKLTLNKDGLLRLTLNPVNGQYTYMTLYDHDGTTVLNSQYSSSTFSTNTDGLAAGVYYVKVNTYYNTGFTPYILSDSLFTYADTADIEPNNKPYLAKTLPANGAVNGHVGFYYNNQRDSSDWYKINYTGSGALTVTASFEPTKLSGYQYTYLQVFKDTLAAPVYSNYTAGPSLTASLTSLTQAYYYVRIITYYNSGFEAYSLTNTFTQVNKAKIKLVSSVSAPDCSSTNSLTLKCSGSKPPYSVQLIRFGANYGSPLTVKNTNAFTFNNLPYGVYTAKVYGDGATGSASSKLTPVTLAAVPTNLTTTNITATQAKLNWTAQSCVSYYTVQYRKLGDTGWITANTVGPVSNYLAKPLTAATSYEWQVAPVDSANGVSGTGDYSVLDTFTTKAAALITQSFEESEHTNIGSGDAKLIVYPNPAAASFTIQYSALQQNAKVSVLLKNMNGATIWNKMNVSAASVAGTNVNVSHLANGVYVLQIIDGSTNIVTTTKVIVSR